MSLSQERPDRRAVVAGQPQPDRRARPDHHARRLRGARRLDGHAHRRAGARRHRAVRLGVHGVHARLAHRHRRRRRRSSTGAGWAGRSWPGSGCSPSASSSVASRRRWACSSPRGSSRAWAPARSRRSPTSPSGGACPSACGRRCSRRCRRPGSSPGVIGPAIAGIVGETIGWRFVFLGLLPLIGVAALIAYPAVRRVGPPDGGRGSAEAAAAASTRRRLPLALVVAAGTGLLLAGLTSGEPALLVVVVVGAAWPSACRRCGRLTPPGTLRAARGLPAAVLMRGILTFTFFGVDAYVALALVEWRGLTAIEAGIALTAATLTWTSGSWIQARLAPRYAARALRPGRAGRRHRRPRAVRARPPAGGPAVARRPDLRHRRAGHGPGLLAARAHRPARGADRRAGLGVVGPLAARLARDGARARASPARSWPPRSAATATPVTGLAVGFAVADRGRLSSGSS